MKSPYKGLKRIMKAFSYSKDGFIAVFKTEAAFRQDLVFCLFFGFLGCFLPVSSLERAFLILTLFLILLAELINTAIEVLVDRISSEYHDLSKKAKDIGSLIVLIAFIHMFIVWGILLFPYLRLIGI